MCHNVTDRVLKYSSPSLVAGHSGKLLNCLLFGVVDKTSVLLLQSSYLMVLMVLIVLLKLFVIVIAEILTVVDNSSNKRFCSMECMAFEVYCIGVTVQQNIKYKAHFFIYPPRVLGFGYR